MMSCWALLHFCDKEKNTEAAAGLIEGEGGPEKANMETIPLRPTIRNTQ